MPEERPVTLPHDTTPEAERVHLAALRQLGEAGRDALGSALTESVRRTILDGIRQRHPHYTERQVLLAYARQTLGDELFRAAYPGETIDL